MNTVQAPRESQVSVQELSSTPVDL